MAQRVHDLAVHVVERYDGDAAQVWAGATTGQDLLQRVGALPGFGEQKAKIFVALLGTKRMSLSCMNVSVALADRIFFKLTGISSRPCGVVRMSLAELFAAVGLVPMARATACRMVSWPSWSMG